jgi:hypothetical protein
MTLHGSEDPTSLPLDALVQTQPWPEDPPTSSRLHPLNQRQFKDHRKITACLLMRRHPRSLQLLGSIPFERAWRSVAWTPFFASTIQSMTPRSASFRIGAALTLSMSSTDVQGDLGTLPLTISNGVAKLS